MTEFTFTVHASNGDSYHDREETEELQTFVAERADAYSTAKLVELLVRKGVLTPIEVWELFAKGSEETLVRVNDGY